jgi:hypothetical protein
MASDYLKSDLQLLLAQQTVVSKLRMRLNVSHLTAMCASNLYGRDF